jgi:hypothetical protein
MLSYPSLNVIDLSPEDLHDFAERGYLILPGLLPDDLASRVKLETDRWVDEGLRAASIACCIDPDVHGRPPVMEIELPAHGELVGYPPLLHVLSQLMGPEFAFHHLHSDRQAPDLAGKPWHHDYEQNPQSNRTHAMIHTLHYLEGLDGRTAALVVLPGSHRRVADKGAMAHMRTAPLPGEVVIDRLPPGSTVVLHSALFHARRQILGGPAKSRYMVDASYCQEGVRWPPVKPYWRSMLRRGRELGLDRGWPELFAERHFAEYVKPRHGR